MRLKGQGGVDIVLMTRMKGLFEQPVPSCAAGAVDVRAGVQAAKTVAVLDGDNAPVLSFTWGTDLSGSVQGAGGVGGLLWMTVPSGANAGTYSYAYDGNGNVMALVSAADGSVAARYEYGPFGELIRATGPMAKVNPFRFSTKYQDEETGLVYYGYRYYDPGTGRWPNRDPLGELGFETLRRGKPNLLGDGPNLYTFVQNDPVDRTDSLGLAMTSIDAAMEACMRLPTPAMQ